MPSTTAQLAIPIPLDADPVADGALAIRNAMNDLDARIKSGSSSVVVTASASGSLAVTFATAFSAGTPKIIACQADTANPSAVWHVAVANKTNTGFTINVRHIDNSSVSVTVKVDWWAFK